MIQKSFHLQYEDAQCDLALSLPSNQFKLLNQLSSKIRSLITCTESMSQTFDITTSLLNNHNKLDRHLLQEKS